jgi:hypothetical protein
MPAAVDGRIHRDASCLAADLVCFAAATPAAHNGHALGDFTIPHPSTNRDAKGTTLYNRGPDIKEIETAMRFDGGR